MVEVVQEVEDLQEDFKQTYLSVFIYIYLHINFTLLFTDLVVCVILLVKGYVFMDKEWLKYWQKVEDLETEEIKEEEKNTPVEEAKELYKSVLTDDN